MSGDQPTEDLSLPLTIRKRIEQVCDRFETAWKRGSPPAIEGLLAGWREPERSALLRELIVVDIGYRRRQDARLTVDEYLERFPHDAPTVRVAWSIAGESSVDTSIGGNTRCGAAGAGDAQPAEPGSAKAATPSEPVPAKIGRYQVRKRLGSGGFGTVYLAYDDQLRREVAIKVPRRDRIAQSEDAEAYLAEAQVLASLDHPNIVPVFDVGQTPDGLCFVVSKLIDGEDLSTLIDQDRLPHREAAELVATVGGALHYAHKKKIIHRDIKPANILIATDGTPYVADFGLALREEDFGKQSSSGGTPAYMSPEQARDGGHLVDGRSDIFSLGVVFYELLSGERPFKGATYGEVLERVKTLNARPPRQLDDTIPKALERICLKALSKEVTDRYSTAADMAADLQHYLDGQPPSVTDPCREWSADTPKLLFEDFGDADLTAAPVGQLNLLPASAGDAPRPSLAMLAVERGVDGFVHGEGPIESIRLRANPTLDDLLATTLLKYQLAGRVLPQRARDFARYAALAREGLKPSDVPLPKSLEGVFAAIRSDAGEDLTNPTQAARFLEGWSRMEQAVIGALQADIDPFATALVDGPQFAREQAYLKQDRETYRQDVARGEQWRVTIPEGPPSGSALLLRRPKSLLFKFWARADREAGGGDGCLLLAVDWGDGRWVFSTDPVQRLSLKPLADALQREEARVAGDAGQCGKWFDGAPYNHTLVSAPSGGTQLSERQVVRTVRRWTRAKTVMPHRRGRRRALFVGAAAATFGLIGWLAWFMQSTTTSLDDGATPPAMTSESRSRTHANIPGASVPYVPTTSRLHVLCIGISDYLASQGVPDLNVADQDAKEIADVFQRLADSDSDRCRVKKLVNKEATRSNILSSLSTIQEEAVDGDLVLLTFSGHGKKDRLQQFIFLPYDFDPAKEDDDTGVTWAQLEIRLRNTPCPVLLMMDTCHSGEITRLSRGLHPLALDAQEIVDQAKRRLSTCEKGVVAIASSMAQQEAFEDPKWGHGALSLALLEALNGKYIFTATCTTPLPKAEGQITLEELRRYIIDRVNELTHGQQKAVASNTGNISLTDIAINLRP